MQKRYLGPIYLSLAASIWGGMYVSSKYLLDTIPPFTLLFFRFLLATVALLLVSKLQRTKFLKIKHWGLFLQIGIIGYFLSIGSQFIGTKLSNAHLASLITTLSPIFLSIFAVIILKERMTNRQLLAFILAIIGVFIIVGLPSEGKTNTFIGSMVLLFTSLSWGYYSVIARMASAHYSPLQLTTVGIMIALVCTLPVSFVEVNQWQWTSLLQLPIFLNLLFVGVIATAVAFFCWNKGLEITPSHQAGFFFFLQPIVGSVLGMIVLKEQLSMSFIIGSSIIIAGVYFSMKAQSAS